MTHQLVKKLRLLLGLMLGVLTLLQGCMSPRALMTSSPGHPLALYDSLPQEGVGSVAVRIIDQRRQAQTLDQALSDPEFNAVSFRLFNGNKLRAPQIKTLAKNPDGSANYGAVFTNVPVDTAQNYYLTVGLFRRIGDPANPTDPGYSQLANKVGEGLSSLFAVAPGSTSQLVILINAVGQLNFSSNTPGFDPVNPVVVYPGQISVNTGIDRYKDPAVDHILLEVVTGDLLATRSATTVTSSSLTASGGTCAVEAPFQNGNFYVFVKAYDAAGGLLSYRSRAFSYVIAPIIGFVAGKGTIGGPPPNYHVDVFPTRLDRAPGGGVLVVDQAGGKIWSLDDAGNLQRFAGGSGTTSVSFTGPATGVILSTPRGVAADAQGRIYINDAGANVIRRVELGGTISTVAGTGTAGYSGDGGPALSATLNQPRSIKLDATGSLYLADALDNVVRRIDPNGIITTVAGNGAAGYTGDGGLATQASLNFPSDIAFGSDGTLYIADANNHVIRRVSPDGHITTHAGAGTPGYAGDGGPAALAQLNHPYGLAVDAQGSLYVADDAANAIRRIDGAGQITTVAGNGVAGMFGDGLTPDKARLSGPWGLCFDANGRLVIADTGNHAVRRVSPSGRLELWLGQVSLYYSPSTTYYDYGTALCYPNGVASYVQDMFFSESYNHVVRLKNNGHLSAFVGDGTIDYSGDGGPAASARLHSPNGLACRGHTLYIADTGNHVVRMVDYAGIITTFAGNGLVGTSGDGGSATTASLIDPMGLAVDSKGNVFVSDASASVVRKVALDGVISTVAGDRTSGYAGDGGPAVAAKLSSPRGLSVDPLGNLYIADSGNHVVRRVDAGGTITTVAGTGVSSGASVDGTPATQAALVLPYGVTFEPWGGTVYITDWGASKIRTISPNGLIGTAAGGSQAGYSQDSYNRATYSLINHPDGIWADPVGGGLIFADSYNHRVRSLGIP